MVAARPEAPEFADAATTNPGEDRITFPVPQRRAAADESRFPERPESFHPSPPTFGQIALPSEPRPRPAEPLPWPSLETAEPVFNTRPTPEGRDQLYADSPAISWPDLSDTCGFSPTEPVVAELSSDRRIFAPIRPEQSERSWNV
jgi:hypothetical protein